MARSEAEHLKTLWRKHSSVDGWREKARPLILRKLARAVHTIRWSPQLLRVVLEELHVEVELERVTAPRAPIRSESRYAGTVAMALILRHSWRPDDLAYILGRLRFDPSHHTGHIHQKLLHRSPSRRSIRKKKR